MKTNFLIEKNPNLKGNLLSFMTRQKLRDFAKSINVECGQNKADTIFNLIRNSSKFDIELQLTLKSKNVI